MRKLRVNPCNAVIVDDEEVRAMVPPTRTAGCNKHPTRDAEHRKSSNRSVAAFDDMSLQNAQCQQ